MGIVLPFQKRIIIKEEKKDAEEVLVKLYNNTKLNNILHEFIMASDKILQANGFEYKGEGDRDFVKDETHKAFLSFLKVNIKEKEELKGE